MFVGGAYSCEFSRGATPPASATICPAGTCGRGARAPRRRARGVQGDDATELGYASSHPLSAEQTALRKIRVRDTAGARRCTYQPLGDPKLHLETNVATPQPAAGRRRVVLRRASPSTSSATASRPTARSPRETPYCVRPILRDRTRAPARTVWRRWIRDASHFDRARRPPIMPAPASAAVGARRRRRRPPRGEDGEAAVEDEGHERGEGVGDGGVESAG